MKKQKITDAAVTSSATNSLQKGLQQYYTPFEWAKALGAALPYQRRTIADLHCGKGTLAAALATPTTRDLLGLDIDPQASLREPTHHIPNLKPSRIFAQGDILDLLPLLHETETTFDLLALNPPFSLTWPTALLPGPLRKGLGAHIDSTHATLRMIPDLLSPSGEALVIANQSTLSRLRASYPDDFSHVWLWLDLPSFFPGVSKDLRVGVLYFAKDRTDDDPHIRRSIDPATDPDSLATLLHDIRASHFRAICIENPWDANAATAKLFDACTAEMTRRRDPCASNANVTLATNGTLRTWVTSFQEASSSIDPQARGFLKNLNRQHPMALTIQRGTRQALSHVLSSGTWSISPDAAAAIQDALETFERDRAPLYPVSDIQRVGWLDESEELLCTADFPPFVAGQSYPLSSETVDWKKLQIRPRYRAGLREEEEVSVKGSDLRITLHHPAGKVAFMYCPAVQPDPDTPCHSLEDLAAHFALPEVTDIASLRPQEYQAKVALLEELESLTSR